MKKYIVIKEFSFFDSILLKIGDEVEISEDESIKFKTEHGFLDLKFESLKPFLEEKKSYNNDFEVSIKPLYDEDVVKDYRIQLDVKTTRKKAKEIEKFLRDSLDNLI